MLSLTYYILHTYYVLEKILTTFEKRQSILNISYCIGTRYYIKKTGLNKIESIKRFDLNLWYKTYISWIVTKPKNGNNGIN